MFTFADQVDAMQEALSTERSEGISEGVSTGKILGAVETMRDDGKSNQDIVARLMVKYSLTQEQAERYVLAPVTM